MNPASRSWSVSEVGVSAAGQGAAAIAAAINVNHVFMVRIHLRRNVITAPSNRHRPQEGMATSLPWPEAIFTSGKHRPPPGVDASRNLGESGAAVLFPPFLLSCGDHSFPRQTRHPSAARNPRSPPQTPKTRNV